MMNSFYYIGMFEVKDVNPLELEEEDFDTVMAEDITFKGNIRFAKPFMIKGKVTGNIKATSDLVIDTNATVDADISADRVVVKGKVKGNVTGTRLVHVSSTGSVSGDITTGQVVLEPGCVFEGKCNMIKVAGETK